MQSESAAYGTASSLQAHWQCCRHVALLGVAMTAGGRPDGWACIQRFYELLFNFMTAASGWALAACNHTDTTAAKLTRQCLRVHLLMCTAIQQLLRQHPKVIQTATVAHFVDALLDEPGHSQPSLGFIINITGQAHQ
jgi:hypothetical protein